MSRMEEDNRERHGRIKKENTGKEVRRRRTKEEETKKRGEKREREERRYNKRRRKGRTFSVFVVVHLSPFPLTCTKL